ncbi:50S ribosomal protein L32 [Candidatus Dojkabacteria bacterium]|nr:50S ribosomal protein L32 [Candidatus Dojkabacteria bacterium]
MGALPKRKISKARRDRRRSQDKLKIPAMSICPKCKEVKRPHFKCPNCGHYGTLSAKDIKDSKIKAKATKK